MARTELDWVPTAAKNRQKVTYRGPRCPACGRGKWLGVRTSDQATVDKQALALIAASLRASSHRAVPLAHGVGLHVTFLVGRAVAQDQILVEVYDLGPEWDPTSPMLRRGRRRDLDNMAQTIADGFQGHLYEDDSQVAELVVRRQFRE